MEKKFCRRVNIINYEYFTYDGTEEGRQKALEWLKSIESDAQLYFSNNEWILGSLRIGECIVLENRPRLILYQIGCGRFFSVSLKCLGRDYEILPTDYFDED